MERREWLLTQFTRKKERNQAYSLRSFARFLGVPSGRLSELMNGKRGITPKMAIRFAKQLGENPDQFQMEQSPYSRLSDDKFEALSDSLHIALLSLVETTNFDSRIESICARLNAKPFEVHGALERLERLGLLSQVNNCWISTKKNLETSHDVASAALRKSHKQTLEQSIDALDQVDLSQRDITSITMAIDVKKIPLAKEMIRKFRRELAAILETDERTEVYNLNVQLVPVSKTLEKK